jgi:transcription factor MBP1
MARTYARPISKYSQHLLDYFVQSKVEELPDVLVHPPGDFDVNAPIDDEGHTALHWASAMGRLTVVRILCDLQADIFQANNEDQIPLVRSIMFTNNYDARTFNDLVTYLRPSIVYRNKSGRTVFHQIATMTSHRSKWSASRYYLEVLIKDLYNQSSTDQLGRLKQVLDYQDINGDPAITICARNQARKFCRILHRAHADPRIPNAQGRTAEEYIQAFESQRLARRQLRVPPAPNTQYGVVTDSPSRPVPGYPPGTTVPFSQRPPTAQRALRSYISETAIRATQKGIPALTEHLESLAGSFDAELVDKEADLAQAKVLLGNMDGEIESSKRALVDLVRMFREVDNRVNGAEDVVVTGENVLKHLLFRVEDLTRKLRSVVERGQARDLASLVREEEQRTQTEKTGDQETLTTELTGLQVERRGLVDRIVEIYASRGSGENMAGYRRLIALCIGQRPDQVDGLLEQLYQVFSEEDQNDSGGGDVVMTGME